MSNRSELAMNSGTEADALLAAGMALADALPIGNTQVVVVPDGYKVEDLERLLDVPARKRGTYRMRDALSFVGYYARHRNSVGTSLYGRVNPPSFMAVFDDHRMDSIGGWRDHVCVYECPLSVEWLAWIASNKKVMKQADFAQFIEDNLPDIVEPAGADMLLISRTLEAKKKINFASGVRLDNGEVQLTYEEEVAGTAAKGKLQIPETFSIGISVLEGGPRYKLTARLRYRIEGGNLTLWYDLLRTHKVLEDAVLAVWQQIETDTGDKIFNGTPDVNS